MCVYCTLVLNVNRNVEVLSLAINSAKKGACGKSLQVEAQ